MTSPKLWHVAYLLPVFDILISWLNLLNGKRFYFLCVIIKLTRVTWQPPIRKKYRFEWNVSPHILHTKNCRDLNLDESLCIFTFFLFPDSELWLLNGFDFYFDLYWMAWQTSSWTSSAEIKIWMLRNAHCGIDEANMVSYTADSLY